MDIYIYYIYNMYTYIHTHVCIVLFVNKTATDSQLCLHILHTHIHIIYIILSSTSLQTAPERRAVALRRSRPGAGRPGQCFRPEACALVRAREGGNGGMRRSTMGGKNMTNHYNLFFPCAAGTSCLVSCLLPLKLC